MRKLIQRIILSIALVISSVPFASAQTFSHQGVDRAYRLVGSPTGDRPAPLIVHLHGVRSPHAIANATNTDHIAWSQLEQSATKNGYLVLSPIALKGRWNMGLDLPNITLPDGQVADDMGLIIRMVSHLVKTGLADPGQIYLTGISDGGILANRILCQPQHPFRAAASIIGAMVEEHSQNCTNRRPIPILLVSGTEDAILPYQGRVFPTGRELGTPEIAAFWAGRQGCATNTSFNLSNRSIFDRSTVTQIDWQGCKDNGAVRILRVNGGGHRVPSRATPTLKHTLQPGRNRDIETAEKVLEFFHAISP